MSATTLTQLSRIRLRREWGQRSVDPFKTTTTTSRSVPSFRGDNAAAQTVTAQAWILSGPAETGKTFAALWRLDTLLGTTPGATAALVRKVRADMDSTVLNTHRRIIALSGSGAMPYGGNKPEWYDYPNGARLYVGGMDRPGKILSGERDWIYVNQAEELTIADWETLSTRVTGRGAVTDTPMLFGDCNPSSGDHWIQAKAGAADLVLLTSRHENNPALHDGTAWTEQGRTTLAVLDRLTGVRKQRLRYGLWVGVEGAYFTEWDEDRHVISPFPIPADWPVWVGFDYGRAHNTAAVFLTRNDGNLYAIAEHVRNRWPVRQHAADLSGIAQRLGRRVETLQVVAGHDCFIERSDDADATYTIARRYEEHGISMERANIDRIGGASLLAELLGVQEAGEPPRLFVFDTCPRLIATIPAMPADPNRPEDVKKTDADTDGKGGDDPYDALRYGAMQMPRSYGFAVRY